MRYTSTRNKNENLSFNEVLIGGLATDGGLFLPSSWPNTPIKKARLKGFTYSKLAAHIMKQFVGEDLEASTITSITENAYKDFTRSEMAAPMVEIGPSMWLLELFHGPTLSFKDFALQVVSRMFDHVLSQKNEHVTVIGATSGDTGSAAIEACKNRGNIDLFMLHPIGRVSEIQRKQMTSVRADNIHNIAIEGSFDDCQKLVKMMFEDSIFRKDLSLAAVNSINWARIMAQVVYYYSAAIQLPESTLTFSVPTGNFGNVYAGYVAKRTGLDIGQLLVATNQNDILHRTLSSGLYSTQSVVPGISPSMDIQVASNFERYLFDLNNRDDSLVKKQMQELKVHGEFSLGSEKLQKTRKDFISNSVNQQETLLEMERVYGDTGLLIDPHTAVGTSAARALNATRSNPVVCLATAHPAKFPATVAEATGQKPDAPDRLMSTLTKKERFKKMECNLSAIQSFIRQSSRRVNN